MDNFRSRMCCCQIFQKEALLRRGTKLAVLFDGSLLAFWIFVYIFLFIGFANPLPTPDFCNTQKTNKWYPLTSNACPYQGQIFYSFAIIMIPIVVLSFLKVQSGIICWVKDGGRNLFIRYYNYSFVYYLSFIVELGLIMLTSTVTISPLTFTIIGLLILLCFPAWIFLHWHLQYIEVQYFKLNSLRN